MAGPQDRDRGPSRDKKFDAVWGELLGDASDEAPAAEAASMPPASDDRSDRTRVWDDSARAPSDAQGEAEAQDEEAEPAPTRIAHAGIVAKKAHEAAAAREMQRLMEGETGSPSEPSEPSEPSGPVLRVVATDEEPNDADEDREVVATELDAPADAPADAPVDAPAIEREASRDATIAAEQGASNKMLVALVGVALAVGVGWFLARDPARSRVSGLLAEPPPAAPIQPDPGASPASREPVSPARPATTPTPAAQAGDGTRDGADDRAHDRALVDEDGGSTGAEPLGESDDASPEPDDPHARPAPEPSPEPAPEPTPDAASESGSDSASELREPPPGTPAEIAAEFRKLPVSAADRPPVGGVGARGIHVDRIWMGSQYEGGDCTGKSDRFSVSADPRPSVCVRVVHPREKDEVSVVWEKKGGSTRRTQLTIKPTHAYRTRAYLLLRKEYVGEWTVRILSKDGVELAAHAFEVVE